MNANTAMPDDALAIRTQLSKLLQRGQVVEIRIPKGGKHGTIAGFFDNGNDLSNAALEMSGKFPGLYFTLNPVKPELLERSRNKLTYNCDRATLATDDDIAERRWLLIDADPVRPADTSSTDAEHDDAIAFATRIRDALTAKGWPLPILADSGNGAHLLYKVALPNDDASKELLRGVLRRLAADFDTAGVQVDRKVFNASRICKIYGTISCKGKPSAERPHRDSKLLDVPAAVDVVPVELLAACQPVPEQKPANVATAAPAGLNKYAMTALDSALAKIAGAATGTRNDTLNTEAFGIAQLCAGGELNKDMAWLLIEQTALAAGLDKGEVRSTMLSAFDAGATSPRNAPELRIKPKPAQPDNVDPETGEILEPAPKPKPKPAPANDNVEPEKFGFTILGYDRDSTFVFPHEAKQVKELRKGDMTETGLLSLAPIEFWQDRFPKKAAPFFNKTVAVDWIFRAAYLRGVFNPDMVRGRGAWRDASRVVFHFGDRLHVDGDYKSITQFPSRYIYQAERPFPRFDDVEPLTSDEGDELLQLATMFRWSVPASAALLAGWCVLAPVCGVLQWRPHIWLTGGPGSGKSTVVDKYVQRLLGQHSVFAQGNSTEAGLRQTLRGDAIPVLFDESEQNNERETQRMQSVLSLIRQASSESGAKTYKGTTAGVGMQFNIRSMFCLASVQVGIQQQADRERLTVLAMREKPEQTTDNPDDSDQWQRIKSRLYAIERDTNLPRRLLHRTVSMMPVLLASIDVFVEAAAVYFGNQRAGDQYGTLLAGAWCLTSSRAPSRGEAMDAIAGFDWKEYTDTASSSDSDRAMRTLLDSRLRTSHGSEFTVFELVDRIAEVMLLPRGGSELPTCQIELPGAQGTLQRYGMKVIKGQLMLAHNSEGLGKLFAGTQFAADYRGLLSRIPGVIKSSDPAWIAGKTVRCLAIPISSIV